MVAVLGHWLETAISDKVIKFVNEQIWQPDTLEIGADHTWGDLRGARAVMKSLNSCLAGFAEKEAGESLVHPHVPSPGPREEVLAKWGLL